MKKRERDFSDIKDCLMRLERVKAIISPLKDTDFPRRDLLLLIRYQRMKSLEKKEKTVEVPLMVKIVVKGRSSP